MSYDNEQFRGRQATTKPDPEPLLTDAGSREPEPTTETEETNTNA